jgi:hypothetical protein
VLPVAFEISSALLLELPSIYSENSRSVVGSSSSSNSNRIARRPIHCPPHLLLLSKTYRLLLVKPVILAVVLVTVVLN